MDGVTGVEASDIIAGLVIAQGQLIRNVGCAFDSAFSLLDCDLAYSAEMAVMINGLFDY